MGVLTDTYNKTFIIKRATTTSATGTDTVSAVYTGSCIIRAIDDSAQLLDASNWGKEFKMWCDNVVIRAGDIITIDTLNYAVLGQAYREDLEGDKETHLEVRLLKR